MLWRTRVPRSFLMSWNTSATRKVVPSHLVAVLGASSTRPSPHLVRVTLLAQLRPQAHPPRRVAWWLSKRQAEEMRGLFCMQKPSPSLAPALYPTQSITLYHSTATSRTLLPSSCRQFLYLYPPILKTRHSSPAKTSAQEPCLIPS